MILSADDYPAIRASIFLNLKRSDLPDDTIALPIYQGAAEAEVLARDPGAAERTGDDLERVKRAAMLLTAARIAPALRLPQQYTEYQGEQNFGKWDGTARALQLRAEALAEIDAYLTEAEQEATGLEPPTLFAVAHKPRCTDRIFVWPPAGWEGQ
jgi:hypothetical protein